MRRIHAVAQILQGIAEALHVLFRKVNAVGSVAVFRYVPDDVHHLERVPQGNRIRVGLLACPHDAGGRQAYAARHAVRIVQKFVTGEGLLLVDVGTAAFDQVEHGCGVQIQVLDQGHDVFFKFRQFQPLFTVDDFDPAVEGIVAFLGRHSGLVHNVVHGAAEGVEFRHVAAFLFRKVNESEG